MLEESKSAASNSSLAPASSRRQRSRCANSNLRLSQILIAALVCLLPAHSLPAQEQSAPNTSLTKSELFYQGYLAYGCFKFAGGETRALDYYAGFEYDRHNLGAHLSKLGYYLNMPGELVHAREDYSAEFIPFVLLNQPAVTDIYGDPLSPNQKNVPGAAITPLGFRWLWRDGKIIKPLWTVKLGAVVFAQKALSTQATYANFTINSSAGVQLKLTKQFDFRVANEFYHFSNAYVNSSNPGLDTLGINFGLVYHLPASSKW